MNRYVLCTIALVSLLACDTGDGTPVRETGDTTTTAALDASDARELEQAVANAVAFADSMEALLRPVPLLTPVQEAGLRRSSNAQQLSRARSLGVHVRDSTSLAQLIADGSLVRLEDSTAVWVVRELDHSIAAVTPDARRLLDEIGRRFQERLREMGLPAFRVEVTSALRTPATQADLRASNVNAAGGTSTHEYGTTLDIAYESYAAPAELPIATAGSPLDDVARTATRLALERVAARKSRELQRTLGLILRGMEDEGLVMVTLERQQPVYHLTVARRIEAPADG